MVVQRVHLFAIQCVRGYERVGRDWFVVEDGSVGDGCLGFGVLGMGMMVMTGILLGVDALCVC
jgi:hypothetical protein